MDIGAIFSIVILILSVIVHEVAHGYVADLNGDPTARLAGRLTLNPIPHIDLMGSILLPVLLIFSGSKAIIGWAKPVPYNPYNLRNQKWGTFAVAIAGVSANFLIAIIFGLIIRFLAPSLPQSFIDISKMIIYINIFLGVFNILPIPPFDGSKILLALVPKWFYPIEEFAERNFFLVIFAVLFLFPSVLAPIVDFLASGLFRLFTGLAF